MRTVKEIKEDIAKDIQDMDDRRVMDMYRAEIVSGIAIDRLEEICNAERNGRCEVIPCNVGTTTYLLLERVDGKGYEVLQSRCVSYFCTKTEKYTQELWQMYFACEEIGNTLEFRREDFGKTVFLTREDAEKALKEHEQ